MTVGRSKVVHLTSAHPRWDARIFRKECKSLASAGYDVTVVVADGEGDEQRDGVHIVDVGRATGRFGRMFGSVNRVYRHGAALGADVYHLHDPELLMIALRLRRLRGRQSVVVLDMHEDLPRQILAKQWIPLPFRRIASFGAECFENHVAKKVEGIVAATPHIARRFLAHNSNTVNVNNYPLSEELAPVGERSRRKRQICYVGGITRSRGLKPLVEALPLMPGLKLVLCGKFQEPGFEAELRAMSGWQQVDYRGHLDRAAIRAVLAESIAGVVTLFPTPAYVESLPVKMFEYMSAELPVIASDFPLWRQIIEEAGAGVCVDPRSPEAIASAIGKLAEDSVEVERMGASGRHAVLTYYSWHNESEKLVHFYESLL